MGLVYKELKDIGRSMYLYFPDQEKRTAFKRSLITVFRDGDDEASVQELLERQGMKKLAEEKEVILSFPNPVNGTWNAGMEDGKADDVAAFQRFQDACGRESEEPLPCHPNGIPTHEAMMSVWHPMNDTKYLIGLGSGASM
ncbi:MAG: esterase, partial [Lachnospiraceae bacterium]|nr:esterase [Lachnospiraceae bacterium]